MGEHNGEFGSIIYDGNKITIEAEPGTLGDVSITYSAGRLECFWDGTQWVCSAIGFVGTQGQGQGQAA